MSRAEDLIQRGLNKFPGYKGYRDKEDRRDEDKRVRTAIADRIAAMVDKLTAYNATLSAARQFDSLSAKAIGIGHCKGHTEQLCPDCLPLCRTHYQILYQIRSACQRQCTYF